jgi:uncharacterized protein YdeI (YjbR/CyaY-like superfamily)
LVDQLPELLVDAAARWRRWLEENHGTSAGVWVVLAKKGTTDHPTSLTYDQAIDDAVCFGWVDGQIGRRDEKTYRARFTPRRPRSGWSQSNVERVARLTAEGRMTPAGVAAVESAKADGRWEAAYAGMAAIEVPEDLAAALAARPAALETFESLDAANRYAVLYRVTTAMRPATRAQRVERLVEMLARGETLHPRRGKRPAG